MGSRSGSQEPRDNDGGAHGAGAERGEIDRLLRAVLAVAFDTQAVGASHEGPDEVEVPEPPRDGIVRFPPAGVPRRNGPGRSARGRAAIKPRPVRGMSAAP